ncbi:MAG TPA: hypothetical protein VK427_01380 [Kofleriaceae bacterium]|nr:hypothetical protein [Kofleriaceae bacterium]
MQCGRAMAPSSKTAFAPAPSRAVVAAATLVSQLLGTLAFAFGLVWIVALRVNDAAVVAVLVVGALAVFAGGHAHRGSVVALGACAAFDVAASVVGLARLPGVEAFTQPVLARFAAEDHLAVGLTVTGIVAALAAITCIAALPQARRFAAWRGQRVLEAARVRG